MITVILNGYKRGSNLDEQYKALQEQTLQPSEILLWYNNPGTPQGYNTEIGSKIPTAYCTANFGVWARFAFALLAKNEYVCIFDDDTIPGRKWLENCYTTINTTGPGLLGTVGLKYMDPNSYSYYNRYIRCGWPNPNSQAQQVDLVGHSWFFRKEWLSDYWRELPEPEYNICGEDMHFSYILQKYRGINTFVPPHPPEDKEMWGSVKGSEYGADEHSLWETNQPATNGTPFKLLMDKYFKEQRKKGWRLIAD
jgi:hypothetical protein